MNSFPILSLTLFIPILGAIIIMCLPRDQVKAIKYVAAVSTCISMVLSLIVVLTYDRSAGGMQFIENIPWVTDLGVSYALGVDGISIPLLLLTNLIGFSAVYASWHTADRVKEFFALLLILISGVMGTFITTDLFIGEVVAAWADERVFRAGRWHFDEAPDHLRSLHYVAGGQFYVTGASLQVGRDGP